MTLSNAFICDAIRTPFGRYAGALSSVRADDLGAVPLRALMARNPNVDWAAVTDVIYGCANQAGEDNRNVARMSSLLAGLPVELPGSTVNRLCGSGLDAGGTAARAIKAGEAGLMIAGGVESMSRAPFVMPKAESAFSRGNAIHDTTIGWRVVNKLMKVQYGVDSMPETAENVATEFGIERDALDRLALASQQKAVAAIKAGHLACEICAVSSHGWQCQWRKRRRLCTPSGQRSIGSKTWPHAQGSHRWHGHSGCGASHHGYGAGTRDAESVGAHGPDPGAPGCD